MIVADDRFISKINMDERMCFCVKRQIKVNDRLFIEVIKEENDTEIDLLENGERRILAIFENDEEFFYNVLYDDTYIVVYSQKFNFKHRLLKIEVAYNYKTQRLVNLANDKLRNLLEYRFILKQSFDLRVVLSLINNVDLKLISSYEEVDRFIDYLKAGNEQVSRDDIVAYILKKYPILKKHANLTSPPYVADYLKIVEDVGDDGLYFHAMPITLNDGLKNKR